MINHPDKCDVCRLTQKSVCDINFKFILRIDQSCELDNLKTVISFLVHKEWLSLLSLYSELRCRNIELLYNEDELSTCLKI